MHLNTKKNSWTDIAILHPNTLYKKGRPQWLITADTKPVEFENENFEMDYPVMALAYKKGDNIKKAIPVDIVELQKKSDKAYFVLDKGSYNIVVANKEDQSFKYELEVK
jgi:hypothetical protein